MDNQFLSIESKKDTMITRKRQIERGVLSKAIYMITNLFAEDEPLKIALRREAVRLLADTKNTYQVSTLKDMLRLSADIGLISDVNTKILLEAVESIKDIGIKKEPQVEIADMFDASSHDVLGDVEKIHDQGLDIETGTTIQLSDSEYNQTDKETEDKGTDKTEKGDKLEHGKSINQSKTASEKQVVSANSSVMALDIGARRKKILEVVRSKGQATIHEFISSIQGCSSKTIQRELTSLVLSGTLKKTGERRWSKYSLR